jgi:hypothetical protein
MQEEKEIELRREKSEKEQKERNTCIEADRKRKAERVIMFFHLSGQYLRHQENSLGKREGEMRRVANDESAFLEPADLATDTSSI